KVARAALVRAQVQKEYQVLRAPFGGTVTARFADPGTLLPAATGSTSSAQPLLEVAQLDRLRVALQLGQDDAARVRVGDKLQLQTQRVRVGGEDGGKVEVLDGLRGGEVVALNLGPEVPDGSPVRVQQESHLEGR